MSLDFDALQASFDSAMQSKEAAEKAAIAAAVSNVNAVLDSVCDLITTERVQSISQTNPKIGVKLSKSDVDILCCAYNEFGGMPMQKVEQAFVRFSKDHTLGKKLSGLKRIGYKVAFYDHMSTYEGWTATIEISL